MDSRAEKKQMNVDVICQHTKEGLIIPIKIRVADEDGELQTYQVRRFRERSIGGEKYKMPNEVWASNYLRRFECKITIFSVEKTVELFYNGNRGTWILSY